MKRLILAALMVCVGGGVCFAQLSAKPAATKAAVAVASQKPAAPGIMVVGTLDSVVLADPAKGTKSEIVVIDPSGKSGTVMLTPVTVIHDKDMKIIAADKLVKGAKVQVHFVQVAGMLEALSVKIVE